MFAVTELFLHRDVYEKRCRAVNEHLSACDILLTQMIGAALVILWTSIFFVIYIRVTIIVLKCAHGTFNMKNALHLQL
jgi:hypothetical protein